MKILVLISASIIAAFINGCAATEKSRNISNDTSNNISNKGATVPALASDQNALGKKNYSCIELIKIYKLKIKKILETSSSPIQLDFIFENPTEISNVKVRILEGEKHSEVFSSDGKVVEGTLSSENKKPLTGLVSFKVAEENGDRFEFFVAPNAMTQDQFFGYGKISFDEDASKLTRLSCAVNGGQ